MSVLELASFKLWEMEGGGTREEDGPAWLCGSSGADWPGSQAAPLSSFKWWGMEGGGTREEDRPAWLCGSSGADGPSSQAAPLSSAASLIPV